MALKNPFVRSSASLSAMLEDFDVLSPSSVHAHSVRRRDLLATHVEKEISFRALQRLAERILPVRVQTASDGFSFYDG